MGEQCLDVNGHQLWISEHVLSLIYSLCHWPTQGFRRRPTQHKVSFRFHLPSKERKRGVGAIYAKTLLGLLCNDVNMIFWKLIIFDMFAGTAKLHDKPQELSNAEGAVVKGFTLKPT